MNIKIYTYLNKLRDALATQIISGLSFFGEIYEQRGANKFNVQNLKAQMESQRADVQIHRRFQVLDSDRERLLGLPLISLPHTLNYQHVRCCFDIPWEWRCTCDGRYSEAAKAMVLERHKYFWVKYPWEAEQMWRCLRSQGNASTVWALDFWEGL